MELGREDGAGLVDHAFVTGVIKVDEILLPFARQRGRIHSVAVILAGDVASPGREI